MFLSVLSVLKNGGSCIIKRHVPIDNAQEIFLLNLFYNSFEQTIAYKPRVNQQSQEYYIIGIGYNKLNNILETLETLQKNYVEITQIDDVQEQFLLQYSYLWVSVYENLQICSSSKSILTYFFQFHTNSFNSSNTSDC